MGKGAQRKAYSGGSKGAGRYHHTLEHEPIVTQPHISVGGDDELDEDERRLRLAEAERRRLIREGELRAERERQRQRQRQERGDSLQEVLSRPPIAFGKSRSDTAGARRTLEQDRAAVLDDWDDGEAWLEYPGMPPIKADRTRAVGLCGQMRRGARGIKGDEGRKGAQARPRLVGREEDETMRTGLSGGGLGHGSALGPGRDTDRDRDRDRDRDWWESDEEEGGVQLSKTVRGEQGVGGRVREWRGEVGGDHCGGSKHAVVSRQ